MKFFDRVKHFLLKCHRVLKVTKKLDMQEFKGIVKISALGMAIIGFIGFLIHMMHQIFF